MKIRVEHDGLADAVSWVARSVPARPPVPVLGGVLLDATSGDALTISGFDYEVSAQVTVDAVIETPGKTLVSGRLLADITKALPNRPVDITVDGARVAITCGSAKFSLPTMPVEDYPELPAMPDHVGSVPGDLFSEAVAQVAVAAGKDETLPMLTGIRVELNADQLTMVATDRFRLAMREFSWEPSNSTVDSAVLVPAKSLADSAKTLGSGGGNVEISLASGDGLLGLAGNNRRNTTRLLDAEFPKYRQLLPTESAVTAQVEVAPLVEAIRRVSLVAERGTQVRLELPVELAGEELTIAFNPHYLLDGLGALKSSHAKMLFTTANRPALIKPVTEDGEETGGYLYLLMPVRLPG